MHGKIVEYDKNACTYQAISVRRPVVVKPDGVDASYVSVEAEKAPTMLGMMWSGMMLMGEEPAEPEQPWDKIVPNDPAHKPYHNDLAVRDVPWSAQL